jgi:hypothetical protein
VKLYAELPGRLARQLLADLLAVAWVVVLFRVGELVHDLVLGLQTPASGLNRAGATIAGAFALAAQSVTVVPFVGDELATGLDQGRVAGLAMAQIGQDQYETVSVLAPGSLVLIVLLGVLPLLVLWLPLRVGYARSAAAAVACRADDTGLLALRALTRVPVRRLRTACPDPTAAWRRGDPDAMAALAACELRRLGLRDPRAPRG